MSFNFKKIAQQPQGNPYADRFNGAVIKNGDGPWGTEGLQLTDGAPPEPLKVDEIISALREVAQSGKIAEQTRSNPQLLSEINNLVSDQSQSFEELSKGADFGNKLITFKQWIDTILSQDSPLLTGDSNTMRNTAGEYLKLFENFNASQKQGTNTMANNSFNLKKYSESKTSYEKEQTEDQKKKHGGNPFRVLMGIVGKLLDKGWNQSEIIRHVKKRINFDPKTIKDCIKIVKEYNKKKHRETKAFNLKNIITASAMDRASDEIILKDIYEIERDLNKQSTRELIIKLKYLVDANNFEASTDNDTRTNGPKGNLSSCASEISKIEEALKSRGWSQEDINHEKDIIQSDRYYPFNTNIQEDK